MYKEKVRVRNLYKIIILFIVPLFRQSTFSYFYFEYAYRQF